MAWLRNNHVREQFAPRKLDIRENLLWSPLALVIAPVIAHLIAWSFHSPAHARHGSHLQKSGPRAREADSVSLKGAALYQRYCARCHGSEGRGDFKRLKMSGIPDFTDALWQNGKTDSQLEVSISEGKGKLMPAFADRLNDKEVQSLVSHVRGFSSSGSIPAFGSMGDLDRRYRLLQEELDELRQQFRELSSPPETSK